MLLTEADSIRTSCKAFEVSLNGVTSQHRAHESDGMEHAVKVDKRKAAQTAACADAPFHQTTNALRAPRTPILPVEITCKIIEFFDVGCGDQGESQNADACSTLANLRLVSRNFNLAAGRSDLTVWENRLERILRSSDRLKNLLDHLEGVSRNSIVDGLIHRSDTLVAPRVDAALSNRWVKYALPHVGSHTTRFISRVELNDRNLKNLIRHRNWKSLDFALLEARDESTVKSLLENQGIFALAVRDSFDQLFDFTHLGIQTHVTQILTEVGCLLDHTDSFQTFAHNFPNLTSLSIGYHPDYGMDEYIKDLVNIASVQDFTLRISSSVRGQIGQNGLRFLSEAHLTQLTLVNVASSCMNLSSLGVLRHTQSLRIAPLERLETESPYKYALSSPVWGGIVDFIEAQPELNTFCFMDPEANYGKHYAITKPTSYLKGGRSLRHHFGARLDAISALQTSLQVVPFNEGFPDENIDES